MARITVEDCLEKIDNQYELVLLAKERTSQLNAGDQPLLSEDNDKRTVIALREIAEGKVLTSDLEDSAVNKLRKNPEKTTQEDDKEEIQEDNFDKIYKGEVSKSGNAILPSKRVRQVSQKPDLTNQKIKTKTFKDEVDSEESLKEKKSE